MIKVIINSGQLDIDYTRFVLPNSIQIQRNLNTPSTCSFTMQNFDKTFVLPALRSYVRIFSTKYGRSLFTGYITVDPTRAFNGLAPGPLDYSNTGAYDQGTAGQLFTLNFACTSDEYLLNLKSVDLIPAFVNQTQGAILENIAENLCPGFFDFTYCASGQLVPYLLYDPTVSWSEYAKQFGDASRHRYSVVDRQVHFQPYGDGPLGVSYDETAGQGTFDPFALQTSALTNPIINDITIVGLQEAGNNHEDFFVGDGFAGTFPLRHQVFNGGGSANQSSGKSGTIILADAWSENTFDTQTWQVQDPDNNFSLPGTALNIITASGSPNASGTSFILANNGIELAGGIVVQHGEVEFNDYCLGFIGGLYDDTTLNPRTCEAAFSVTPTPNIVVTASGASGIAIEPYRLGSVPTKAFRVISKINKTYTLTTIISAPAPARYTQVYTTMAGVVYGGTSLQPNVQGSITWEVSEIDQFTGVITNYTFSLDNQPLPSFAIYGPIENQALNISIRSTEVYAPPKGTLRVACLVGIGLLAPIYISGNVQYTGGFVAPSGGNLPILPGNFGPENQFSLGSSLQNQAAEIDIGTINSSLSFYSNDLPGVGVRIRLQTWESQASISRVQNPVSISGEAAVVGDDGIRSSLILNLNPLPRTSEDCDAACQAILADRTGIFYQGTYNASYIFFNQQTNDIDFYPVCGRHLYVNAPRRNINKKFLLVSSITTTVDELTTEIVRHSISFGPDLYLEKVMGSFVDQPQNVLLPQNTVVKLTPQQLAQVGTNYLPDVTMSTFDNLSINGASGSLMLQDPVPAGGVYELRNSDLNWGVNDSHLLARYTSNQTVAISRTSFDQTWYLRFVNTTTGHSSRRSKVLRIYTPLIPLTPAFLYADSSTINCDFNGDLRNIEGIELRDVTDSVVYYQGIVGSELDMMLNLDQLRGQLPAFVATGAIIGGALGRYMKGVVPPTARDFKIHFFNTYWDYSPALSVSIPPPSGYTINEGYRFGSSVEVRVVFPIPRVDILSSRLQLSLNSGFSSVFVDQIQNGQPGAFHIQVPVSSGDFYARVSCSDHISSGAWTPTLHIPTSDLIASDYLTGQGSTPPFVTDQLASIFTLTAVANPSSAFTADVTVSYPSFIITFPNGFAHTVAAQSTISVLGPTLQAGSTYYYYVALIFTGNPGSFPPDGWYVGVALVNTMAGRLAAIKVLTADGSVPIIAQGLPVTTAAFPGGGSTTSNGGGSAVGSGFGGCVSDGTKITEESGYVTLAEKVELLLPLKVKTPSKRSAKITKVEALKDQPLYWIKTATKKIRLSGSQALFTGDAWIPVQEYRKGNTVWTVDGFEQVIEVTPAGKGTVHKFHMGRDAWEDCPHVYTADGFYLHNVIYKE